MPVTPYQPAFRYWRVHVAASIILYVIVLLLVGGSFAIGSYSLMRLATEGRYLCDLLALVFLISASRKGWKFWAPFVTVLVLARAMWLLARIQHWPLGNYIDTGIYLVVPVLYLVHFFLKKSRRLSDWLKLIWVMLLSVLGIGQRFVAIEVLTPPASFLTSALLQLIVFLEWRQSKATPVPDRSWDFEEA